MSKKIVTKRVSFNPMSLQANKEGLMMMLTCNSDKKICAAPCHCQLMTKNMIVLVMRKTCSQMATPKWFLVALSQCQPDQIAAADAAACDAYADDDGNDDYYDCVLDADADVVDDERGD